MQSSASRARVAASDSPDSPATAGEPGATTSWDVALEDVKRSPAGEQRTLLGASRKYCPPDDRRRCCGAPLLLSTLLVAWTVPVALLAASVGLLARPPAPAAPSASSSLSSLSKLSSAAAKPPPSPYKGLERLNPNASTADGFFACWWNATSATVKLEVRAIRRNSARRCA